MTRIKDLSTRAARRLAGPALVLAAITGCAGDGVAQLPAPASPGGSAGVMPTYADLATLAERSDLVIHVRVRDQVALEPERAPGLAPGFARLYVEADTLALIAGSVPLGEELTYLVDVPVRANGKPPKLAGLDYLLFADPVPGQRGSVQLAGPSAQLRHDPAVEAQVRAVLTELVAPSAPPVVSGIRDALGVPGTLTGESETQVFLQTQGGSPVSISVLRRPGQLPTWGVSWGEIIDSTARAPAPGTLRWYRLACSLPETLPAEANLANDPGARELASRDYAYVREQLGRCERVITRDY